MNIKVIIDDGVIRGVLKDCDVPVNVELIDTSDSYKLLCWCMEPELIKEPK